jgi:ATP-binding cassette subfamily F protein uup
MERMGSKIIELQNLKKLDHVIMDNFSYDFQPERTHWNIGKNGTGKTFFKFID